jgi:glycosyltransferase involved in cell wall biosynthesis
MHLVIVTSFPPDITGVGQYGYHITRALAQSGKFSRITVLAGSHRNGPAPNHLGFTEIEYCWKPGQLSARRVILSRLKQLKPDLVWFNLRVGMFGEAAWLSVSGLFTVILTRRMGYPTVVTLHEMVELYDLQALNAPGGPFARWGARLITDVAIQADVICLTMRYYADWLAEKRKGVTSFHIPHGVYHEPHLLNNSGKTELLLFNMLAPYKGLELLLEVFPSLKLEYPDLQLTIAGVEHPRFPGYVRTLKKQFGDLEGVRWAGQVREEDIIELFRCAQIVVLPYTASTGSSSVLCHAATWGRPVVASNLSEIRTFARENNLQVEYFEKGDAESLRNAIQALLSSPSRRLAQAQNNYNAIQEMKPERTCYRYLQAFNHALEKRRSAKRIPLMEPS